MSERFNLICIKCKSSYQDIENDNYLCPDCLKEKELIVKSLDGKFNTIGQVPSGNISRLEQLAKEKGSFFDNGNGQTRMFINVNDL
jgi:DNA-directed RNA polymerase subunit RPC12/RpoP